MNKIYLCDVIGSRPLRSCRPSFRPEALILGKKDPQLLVSSLLYVPNSRKKSFRSLGKVLVKFWKPPTQDCD
jgi:hypothetical protein